MYSLAGLYSAQVSSTEDLEQYPSKTLVLQNVHARTAPAAILRILDELADLDPFVVREIRIRNVKKNGRAERHAFIEFWQLEHAAWVFEHVTRVVRVQCPPPRSGEVGEVVDRHGRRVLAGRVGRGLGSGSSSRSGSASISDTTDSASSTDSTSTATTAPALIETEKESPRYYADIRIAFWEPYAGRADPSIRSKQGWECSECGLPNYEKWEYCYRCGVERPWTPCVRFRPGWRRHDSHDSHGISNASISNASISNASTSNASTRNASTSNASTSNASNSNASTSNASTSEQLAVAPDVAIPSVKCVPDEDWITEDAGDAKGNDGHDGTWEQ